MKQVSVLLLLFMCFSIFSENEKCGYVEYLKHLSKENNEIYEEIKATENNLKRYAFKTQENAISKKVRVIPVVVHIIWNAKSQNISDAQVHSQIRVLNEDYRKMPNTNGYSKNPLATDTKVEFRLATVDPHWKKTTGITRTQTKTSIFKPFIDRMKYQQHGGKNAWDTTRYLNIWVCNMGSKVLGYAQFPNGSRSLGADKTLDSDGVVINTLCFGRNGSTTKPFNLGRTATHEVGHWLGLRHIWGDGGCEQDDGIDDTPKSDRPNNGKPKTRPYHCGNPSMFENYMDYSDDEVLNIFTYQQAQRINSTLTLYRFGLCEWDAFGKGVGEESGEDFLRRKNKDNWSDEKTNEDDFFDHWRR